MNEALIKEFLLESFENLSNISDELTTFEKDPNNKELVNSIFRKVHTLKGSASFLGFQKLQTITHSAESLLDLIREGTFKINSDFIDVLLESFDLCIQILKSVELTSNEPSTDYSEIVKKLQSCIKNGSSSEKINLLQENDLSVGRGSKINPKIFNNPEPVRANSTKDSPVEKNIVIEKEIKHESVAQVKIVQEAKMENKNTETKQNVAESENAESANKNSAVSDSVVRVNVQLLDKIMNVVGELVLNRNQILQYANQMDAPELNRLSQQLNIITSELQTDIMTTRMQPVGSVLSKFERIVRDLARSQNKKIKLEIIGKETELDKTLLEAIRDPLTHLIRNSVDHGVESPEIRKNKGKNEEGKITIRSFHEGGQVSIEIKDDGNGIDSEKVLSKAIQKGIVTAEQGKLMSTKQIQNIIFMAGFSTADQVTNISGRGVGMDVVRSNIENIGGTVDINSEFGHGTTFKLKIPLTLAIVPALVVQDRNETFALPQISLVELVRLDSTNENGKIEKLYDSEFLRLRGELIPVYRLADILKLKNKSNETSPTLVESDPEIVNIVVLNAEGKTYGLIVEQIQDTEEIVVKPLSPELKKLSFFAGATIMGDGRVALILDALGFYNFADKGHGNKIEKMNQELNAVSDTNNADSQELLICELGDHRNYAFPLVLVNRLEEFKSTQIEWTGDQPIVKYGSFPMPLINVESYLKLKGNSVLENCHTQKEVLVPCIVVKIRNHLFGFVVNEIKDISVTDSSIFSDSIDRQGLLGTVFINEKSITILDIHTILEQLNIGKNLFGNKAIKKKGRILMVEDSPLYRKIQSDFLEDQGYDVVLAVNGQEALEILNNDQKFNLIISDIEMPVMDGWTFTETLRKSGGNFSNIPILAVSSRVSPKDKEKSQTSGFNEHIEKLNKDEIIKTIQNYI
jgi:two-component system chemotaxis sensor kinase CheA